MKLLAKLANCEFVRLAGQGINLLNSVLVMVLDKEANAASRHRFHEFRDPVSDPVRVLQHRGLTVRVISRP